MTDIVTRSQGADILTRYAPLAAGGPSSFDAATRTMRAVIAAGAEVERWDSRGRFVEVLDHRGIVVPPGGSVPLLNSHRRGSLSDVLGSATNIAARGAAIEATLKLSRRDDVEPIVADIADGHVSGVSIGYRVLTRSETTDAAGERRVTATRWEIAEVSLVPIPADANAKIRSAATPDERNTANSADTPPPAARAAVNQEIRSIGALAGLDQAWIDAQIDANASADAARAAAFASMQARGSTPIQTARANVVRDHTDPLEIRSAMGEALAHRLAPGRVKLEGRSRAYAGFRMLDMIADLAQARGERINPRDQNALMERAVGAHSNSDFPLLLADAANKSLLANYQAAEPSYRRWAARRPFKDLKAHHFARVGDFPPFQKIGESGEGRYGSISENSEQVFAHSFNSSFGVTRDALINDDLSALADFSSMIARRAAADENRFVYGELIGSTPLRDGKPIFHADHANLGATAAPLSAAGGLAAGVRAIRSQTGLDGLPLNLTPSFLVVGPELEVEARKLLASVTPSKSSDVNPWSGSLEPIVDGNITGSTFFIMVDAADAPSIVYGYVGGNEGPQIFTEKDFDTRGLKVSAWLDFGWGPIDFRGAYKGTATIP